MRSARWEPKTELPDVPTAGEFLKETENGFDPRSYDLKYDPLARSILW